jgi:hypothetical protein
MYKSTYLSVRIHTPEEALQIMPDTNVDILLWLIDVYDLGQNKTCAQAVKKLIMKHYHTLNERVPGLLPRWTKGMMAWVTFLNALVPCYEFDKDWVIQNNMLISPESPELWTIDDLLTTLDAIAMRWKNAHALTRFKLQQYLHCLWSVAKRFTMHLHPHIQNGLKEGSFMKIHPKQIMACFSRFYWFNKTLDLYDLYDREEKTVESNPFFKHELRHFILRKFRDELLTDVWNTIPFYGDVEIAGHESLGEGLSTYSCIYKRHPVCILQKIQQRVLYDKPEDVQKVHSTAVNLKIIQTYFANNHKIDFLKFFVCYERNHTKHWRAVLESTVPVIVQSFGKFSVVSNGKAYCHGKIEAVFPVWVKLAEKPHGLDLTELKNKLFGELSSSSSSTIYELEI